MVHLYIQNLLLLFLEFYNIYARKDLMVEDIIQDMFGIKWQKHALQSYLEECTGMFYSNDEKKHDIRSIFD